MLISTFLKKIKTQQRQITWRTTTIYRMYKIRALIESKSKNANSNKWIYPAPDQITSIQKEMLT